MVSDRFLNVYLWSDVEYLLTSLLCQSLQNNSNVSVKMCDLVGNKIIFETVANGMPKHQLSISFRGFWRKFEASRGTDRAERKGDAPERKNRTVWGKEGCWWPSVNFDRFLFRPKGLVKPGGPVTLSFLLLVM